MDAVLGLSFGLGLLFLFDGWVLKPLTWLWHKLVELVRCH